MNGMGPRITIRSLGEPGDLGWIIKWHGELYASELGWDASFELFVARIVVDFASQHDPSREAAWIAELDGRRAGCVLCVADPSDPHTAKLRALLVHPTARGLGAGGALVEECVSFARTCGYRRLRLWTNDVLVAARRIYESRGFALTSKEPHHSFGVDLIGEIYELSLGRGA
jgi:GNAT superfamily N-acetyltransferase